MSTDMWYIWTTTVVAQIWLICGRTILSLHCTTNTVARCSLQYCVKILERTSTVARCSLQCGVALYVIFIECIRSILDVCLCVWVLTWRDTSLWKGHFACCSLNARCNALWVNASRVFPLAFIAHLKLTLFARFSRSVRRQSPLYRIPHEKHIKWW